MWLGLATRLYPGVHRLMLQLKVLNTGMYAPPRIVTASEIAERVGRTADWVVTHTGVEQRRWSHEPVEEMAAHAARQALTPGESPDLIINASLSQRQMVPDTSVFVQRALGFSGIPSFSIHATCLSFLVALHQASALLTSGANRRILIVSAERGSLSLNDQEPESTVLIGDGAAAAVVERPSQGETSSLLGWKMATWPQAAELAEIRGFGAERHPNCTETKPEDHLFHMNGPALYRMVKRRMAIFVKQLLDSAGISPEHIDLVVPHQASGPGMKLASRLGFAPERVINIVADYGNCIAASLPMALAFAQASGRLQRGHHVLLLGSGAGLSIAGAILRW